MFEDRMIDVGADEEKVTFQLTLEAMEPKLETMSQNLVKALFQLKDMQKKQYFAKCLIAQEKEKWITLFHPLGKEIANPLS